jgi:hypothetical protein
MESQHAVAGGLLIVASSILVIQTEVRNIGPIIAVPLSLYGLFLIARPRKS